MFFQYREALFTVVNWNVYDGVDMYAGFWKRILDILLSGIALLVFSPLLVLLVILDALMMKGTPFFFQLRPGKKGRNGKEVIFRIIKLRTMTNERDKEGNLLPDVDRLTPFGRFIRSTSMDELYQLINVLKGDMSLIGPRPQLVRDMVFMTKEERKRHDVRPGISGLAQIRGRNALSWEGRLAADVEYVDNISFVADMGIIWKTIGKVLRRENTNTEGMETSEDYGDYLLRIGRIDEKYYQEKQREAIELLNLFLKTGDINTDADLAD